MSMFPDAFYQVTASGSLHRYRAEAEKTLVLDDVSAKDTPTEDQEEDEPCLLVSPPKLPKLHYRVVDAGVQLMVVRDDRDGHGVFHAVLDCWSTEGFWTVNEDLAMNMHEGVIRARGLVLQQVSTFVQGLIG